MAVLTGPPPPAPLPDPSPASLPEPRPLAPPVRPARTEPAAFWLYLPGAAMSIVAVLLLGFVAHVTLISQLRFERSQQTAYADFRQDLANAVAPVGQLDENGKLHPLGTPVAVLQIPALGARFVVLEGTTSGVTQLGPGHRRDTVLPGQAGTSIIMGRRSSYGAPSPASTC